MRERQSDFNLLRKFKLDFFLFFLDRIVVTTYFPTVHWKMLPKAQQETKYGEATSEMICLTLSEVYPEGLS